jgi:hypothetical protein
MTDIDDVTAKPSPICKSVEKIPDFLDRKNYMVFECFEPTRWKRGEYKALQYKAARQRLSTEWQRPAVERIRRQGEKTGRAGHWEAFVLREIVSVVHFVHAVSPTVQRGQMDESARFPTTGSTGLMSLKQYQAMQ